MAPACHPPGDAIRTFQSEREPREDRRNRDGESRWGGFHDYSDNQQALNLGAKRAETPSALCRRVPRF